MRTTIREINAFLHITGRTLEERLSSISIIRINVQTGEADPLLTVTEMVVLMNTNALTVMAGKNKSIILKTTN